MSILHKRMLLGAAMDALMIGAGGEPFAPMVVSIDRNYRFAGPFPYVIYHEADDIFPRGAWTVVIGRWVIMYTPSRPPPALRRVT